MCQEEPPVRIGFKGNLVDEPDRAEVVARMRQALLDWLITADEPDQIAPRWSDV